MLISKLFSFMFGMFKRKKLDDGRCEYISFGARYTCVLIDLIIMFVIVRTVGFVTGWSLRGLMASTEVLEKHVLGIDMLPEELAALHRHITVVIVVQIMELLAAFSFCVMCWTKFGGTPSKLLMGMRVLDSKTLHPMSLWQAVLRFASYSLCLLTLGIGVVYAAFDKRCQMVHDKVACTVVVTRSSVKWVNAHDPYEQFVLNFKAKMRAIFAIIKQYSLRRGA